MATRKKKTKKTNAQQVVIVEGATEKTIEEVVTTANLPKSEQVDLHNLECGYVVGVKDGSFIFEIVGTSKDLVKLIGIHKYADLRVTQAFEQSQMTGDALVHELGKALQVINQTLNIVAQAVKKPNTEL